MELGGKNRIKPKTEEVFREYCSSSSIHGIQYFGRTERTPCERFWWIVVFLLSLAGCGMMISQAYVKWKQAPIIVTFSKKATSIRDIPFPAVTICPDAKVSSEKLNLSAIINKKALDDIELHQMENIDYSNKTLSADTISKLKAVAHTCYGIFHFFNSHPHHMNGLNEPDVVNTLKKLSPERENMFNCFFDSLSSSQCEAYMKETITEYGLCYSFNMLPENEIFRKEALHNEHSYVEDWNKNQYSDEKVTQYPLNATDAGFKAGVSLILRTDKPDANYECSVITQGYILLLHEPSEYPQVSKHHIRIPYDHVMNIAVKPQMITTSNKTTSYHWRKRQCFFDNERYLRFFQKYNQPNCELECLTNVTLNACGCVSFSMPRATGVKVCSLDKVECTDNVLMDFRSLDSSENFPVYNETQSSCNCLPLCTSIQYDVEVTQSAIDVKGYLKAKEKVDDSSSYCSLVYIYFKSTHFLSSRRREIYGTVDFLANCGGLLGLFMGISILSLLEICYYISIRPFSLRKQRNRSASLDGKILCNGDSNALLSVATKAD